MSVDLKLRNKQIRKRLIDIDMKQNELAHRVGIDPRYLNDILTGRKSGKKYEDQIFQILDELEVKKKINAKKVRKIG